MRRKVGIVAAAAMALGLLFTSTTRAEDNAESNCAYVGVVYYVYPCLPDGLPPRLPLP